MGALFPYLLIKIQLEEARGKKTYIGFIAVIPGEMSAVKHTFQ